MPTKTLDFNTLTAAAPYVIGSAPDNLTGYTQTVGSTGFNITNLSGTKYMLGNSSSSNSVVRDDTVLTGAIRSAFVTTGPTNGSAVGPCLLDAGNNGYVALTSDGTGNTRLFSVVDSQLGTQIGSSITKTHAANQVREIRWETGGVISLWDGATQIGTNFSNTDYTPIYACALARGGTLRSMASYYVAAQTLTIATDLTPNASRTDTCTGFADGAATISFSGVSVAVTVASGSFTWTVPMLSNGVNWPRLPSTGTTITLTQGGISANASGNITLPAGYDTLRVGDADGGAVANFAGIVTDDDKFLGYHITLTTDDTWYGVTSGNRRVYRDGDVGADTETLPRTDADFQQNTTTGLITSHNVTMTADGGIVIDDTPNSFTFTAVTNANINTTYTSNEVTIAGLGTDVEADLTIVDGLYSKNGGTYTSSAGVISNGDTLRVRRNSSGSYATAVDLDVTVGTYTTQFTITTEADTTPDNIKFVTLSALSDIKTISGLAGSVPIAIVGGEYSKNGGGFTASAGTVVNTDTIQLSSEDGATVRVTIGGKTFSWNSKGGSGGGFGGSIGIGI